MKRTLTALLLIGSLALAQADGAKLYAQCAGCHGANGQGIPGAFPPLAGHMAEILSKQGGREYLIKVLLWGLQGQIEVKGMKYNGLMPSFSQLKDEEIAAVLNHIATAWGDDKKVKGFKPFTAAEVKALREKKLTPQQVLEERKKLGLK
ncbi:cytochrome C biogenesis protein CcsB [Thermus scotoductus]|uniref:Cytochrome C biogenesis protein CcsB n=1 Tax=Thermus scotoductus TaxID=37636 RepID=A0A430SAX8_THESC|nr:cytochrome C-552 [Thermus scotoductus]RTG95915.1 cytochrome C biogenesis protein CcsB [Thermus scotoductus]RTH11242.1 cytochrome C biogenesis protein CcsB [Thermus scotoductus]RTH11927.1 cytochrome C biogenesis protein CcsB [Thermus scotoductus]RTH12675.1 cytochrome C biogenesis protein CcsB [Thermus scotoductus]RTH14471.1 cytochrome C biogenesis protein CcsB [Thermus scotoductus]